MRARDPELNLRWGTNCPPTRMKAADGKYYQAHPATFYESQTCANLHDKSTSLYLYGDLYVADEFMREMEYGM